MSYEELETRIADLEREVGNLEDEVVRLKEQLDEAEETNHNLYNLLRELRRLISQEL
jgi:predicted  nucleic acid-binding Zn-ribbon protein